MDYDMTMLGTIGNSYRSATRQVLDVIVYRFSGGKVGVCLRDSIYVFGYYEYDFESLLRHIEGHHRRFRKYTNTPVLTNDYFTKFYTI